MATIISNETTKRGSCQYKFELATGEVYLLGFNTDAPIKQEPHFSFMFCNILDGYSKDTCGDLFSYINKEFAANGLIMPLYLMPDRNDERIRIGNRIKSLREDKKMEAKRLAQITDIDAANLSRIEQGKFSTGIDTLCKIATALNAYVDIVPCARRTDKGGFSIRKKIWVLPSHDYNPLAPVPGVGGCFWPSNECNRFEIGDLVVFCTNDLEFGPVFVVSDTSVFKYDLPEHYIQYKPWPREDSIFTKLRYSAPIGQEEISKIIELCKQRFNTIPTEATLLDVTELDI